MENAENFLEIARKRAKRAHDAWSVNYDRMDEDIEFLDGDQWPDDVKQNRKDECRPYLTFNKLPSIVDQIVGDQRQMRPAINVFPAQGDIQMANQEVQNFTGTKDYKLSEIYEGIIRNIEYSSNADMAYDTAFEHCAGWGLGYFRILTDYLDESSFDQDFIIRRIRNYKSVLLDPDFQEPDGSDIEWGFIFSKIHKDEFERRYPGKQAVSVQSTDQDQYEIWVDGDYVMLAEYYYLKDHTYTLYQMSDGMVLNAEEVGPILDELAVAGVTIVNERQVKGKKCCWAKISGADVLEEEKDTVFRWIPIIPVLGKELVVDGTPIYRGAIRHAKDAQRMYNYSRTADIERTALVPKVPYVIADKQIDSYENDWENANTSNKSYLKYKHVSGLPAPMRQPPVSTNPGEAHQSMQASDDIKATTGMFDPSMGATSGATSGKQELVLQQKGDRGSFAFSDNMVRSIRHAGRILINAIPKLYDTNRLIRLRFPDDAEDFVEINKTIIDQQTGQPFIVNDMSVGKFDLVVKPGPSYSTQRHEALDSMTQVLQAAPQLWSVIGDLIAKNMDWPGADEFAERLKKMVPPEILDEDEQAPPEPPPPPTPADQAAMAKADADLATADAKKAKADADKLAAEAKMMEVIDKVNNMEESMKDMVADLIAQTIMEMGAGQQPMPQPPIQSGMQPL